MLPEAIVSQADFLAQLRGKGRYKYTRFSGLPLRYAGGKSLAVGHIVEQMPAGLTHLVSPFFGGGSVEIACANKLGLRVRGYDVFDILTNYWVVQLQDPARLAAQLRQWSPDKTTYTERKQQLKGHWDGSRPIANPQYLAALYWFNHNLSYGPGFLGWMSTIYADARRVARLIDKVATFHGPNLSVAHGDFTQTIPRHRQDFLYCDPPYYLAGDSKMFRGIYPQRNFPVHHNGFAHEQLRDLLRAHQGGFILSYNDCAVIREWYADCRLVKVAWQYTLGQGETRIGKNRREDGSGHVKKSHELLIIKEANHPPPARPEAPCPYQRSR